VNRWLLMHIPPGINSYNSAEDVQKGESRLTFWQPELTSRFLQLIRRYRSTIHVAFAGHTHMDDSGSSRPTALGTALQDCPAISSDLREQSGLSGVPVRIADGGTPGTTRLLPGGLADAGQPRNALSGPLGLRV